MVWFRVSLLRRELLNIYFMIPNWVLCRQYLLNYLFIFNRFFSSFLLRFLLVSLIRWDFFLVVTIRRNLLFFKSLLNSFLLMLVLNKLNQWDLVHFMLIHDTFIIILNKRDLVVLTLSPCRRGFGIFFLFSFFNKNLVCLDFRLSMLTFTVYQVSFIVRDLVVLTLILWRRVFKVVFCFMVFSGNLVFLILRFSVLLVSVY